MERTINHKSELLILNLVAGWLEAQLVKLDD